MRFPRFFRSCTSRHVAKSLGCARSRTHHKISHYFRTASHIGQLWEICTSLESYVMGNGAPICATSWHIVTLWQADNFFSWLRCSLWRVNSGLHTLGWQLRSTQSILPRWKTMGKQLQSWHQGLQGHLRLNKNQNTPKLASVTKNKVHSHTFCQTCSEIYTLPFNFCICLFSMKRTRLQPSASCVSHVAKNWCKAELPNCTILIWPWRSYLQMMNTLETCLHCQHCLLCPKKSRSHLDSLIWGTSTWRAWELRDGLEKLFQLCLPCTKVQTFLQKPHEEKPKANRAETPNRNNLKQPSKCITFSTPSPLHSHKHPQKLHKALRFAESQAPLAPLPKPNQEPVPLLGQCAVLLSSCFKYA